jgi:hypothetical protein
MNPLHVMFLGSSGSGKTYLQERVSALIPAEDKIMMTTISEQGIYYFGQYELRHKLWILEDLDGAEGSLYPLREMMSKQSITKTVPEKDTKNGSFKTTQKTVEGPVCTSGCTTKEKIYEDNANRCILLYIDHSKEQDIRIIQYQQKQSAGKIDKAGEAKAILVMQNAQRLLRHVEVINPFAGLINLPQEVFKPRRTMQILLSFIETITFYEQYNRKTNESGAVISTVEDIELAFDLLKETLFRKSDELSGACRNFYEKLQQQVGEEVFYSRQMREQFRMNPSNLKRYMIELTNYGYVKIVGGSAYKGYEYQINREKPNLKSSIDRQIESIMIAIRGQESASGM